MSDLTPAVQLFTVRDFIKTPEGIAESFRRIREIGYTAAEIAGMGQFDPNYVAGVAQDVGLTLCGLHTGIVRMREDFDGLVADLKTLGCEHVVFSSMPPEDRTPEGIVRFAKEASELGRRLAEHGIGLGYHNHNFELARAAGRKKGTVPICPQGPEGASHKWGLSPFPRTGLNVLCEASDPRYLNLELDLYWIQHGGGDPAAWIAKLAGRVPLLHFKDMGMRDGQQIQTEVGQGNLNWPAILEASRGAGTRYGIVEQGQCDRDPFDCLATSFRNMRQMGL